MQQKTNKSPSGNLAAYDPNWPLQFQLEARLITKVLGEPLIAIHHIGSTAVPGLVAKPKIDIVGVLKKGTQPNLDGLQQVGYVFKGAWNTPMKWGFSKRGAVKCNLHLFPEGHPEIKLNLMFRDALRRDSKTRDAYAALKKQLAETEGAFSKKDGFFKQYTLGKDDFIKGVLQKAGFSENRFLHCSHTAEWEKARKLRASYFQGNNMNDSPDLFSKENHHFVFTEGVNIVGYAEVQVIGDQAKVLALSMEKHCRPEQKEAFQAKIVAWVKSKSRNLPS